MKEEEEKRKRLEYICQLQDKVLVENTALLEGTKGSQIVESKHKEVASRDKKRQWLFKKVKGKQSEKYHEDAVVKIRSTNLCERCVNTG